MPEDDQKSFTEHFVENKKCQTKTEKDQGAKDRKPEDKWVTAKGQSLATKKVEAVVADADVDDDFLKTTKMPRPCKRRRVRGRPNSSFFKPAGIRVSELSEVVLTMSEFEVVRLIDFHEMSQIQACEKMEISQSTLSRILTSARKKIADAIINGKAIRIEN